MQIVINIDEEIFNKLPDAELGSNVIEDVLEAVENGTVLPKGHGRLIDADELKRVIQGNDVLNMTGFNVRICDINATPTIIEADKAESEDKE